MNAAWGISWQIIRGEKMDKFRKQGDTRIEVHGTFQPGLALRSLGNPMGLGPRTPPTAWAMELESEQ